MEWSWTRRVSPETSDDQGTPHLAHDVGSPGGELVVVSEQTAKAPAPASTSAAPAVERAADASEAGWLGSSFDLLKGVEITESADDVSGADFDTLFKPTMPMRRP